MATAPRHLIDRRLHLAESAAVLARVCVVALLMVGIWIMRSASVASGEVHEVLHQLASLDRALLRADARASEHTVRQASAGAAEALAALETLHVRDSTLAAHLRRLSPLVAHVTAIPATSTATRTATRTAATPRSWVERASRDTISEALAAAEQAARHVLDRTSRVQRRALAMFIPGAAVAIVLTAGLGMSALRARRRRGAHLASSEETFRRLAHDNPDAVLVHVDGTVVYANLAAAAMLVPGQSPAGRNLFEFVHPDDQATVRDRTDHVLARNAVTLPRALRFVRDDGRVLEAEARAAPVEHGGRAAVLVVLRDLTDRRAAETALRLSEERYRLLADHSADLISRRTVDHVFEYASPSHFSVLGWTPEELVGRSALELLHPDDLSRVAEARRTRRIAAPPTLTARVQHKNGHHIWLELATTELHDATGRLTGYLTSARDVTARRSLEEELWQAQKMEVLGRMASGIAHDFNNLLTIIRSSSELLGLEVPMFPRLRETLDDIDAATNRAAALTAHLLTFSRRQHFAPTRLQPVPVITTALPILRRIGGRDVEISFVVSDDAAQVWIRADAVRFEQVVVNLVGNATDSMATGGTVRLTMDAVTMDSAISHRFGMVSPGDYLTLTVEDTGIGMTEEVLSHLFDPFYTTKAQGRGTGLGLSIVHGIVHEAAGTVTVSSEPGFGSCFTVYWPASLVPDAGAAPAADTASGDDTQADGAPDDMGADTADGIGEAPAGSVLLVDDDASVRRVVARQLESGGYRVHPVGSGAEALAALRSTPAAFDVVVSDVRMPGMTGPELVDCMQREGLLYPVLLMSGQIDAPLPAAWPGAMPVQFLAKPSRGSALLQAIADLSSAGRS